jgi:Tfp pilus assembly protein PilF
VGRLDAEEVITGMDQSEALRLAAEGFDLWQSGRLSEADARYRSAVGIADPRHYRTPDIHGQYGALLTRLHRSAEAGQHLETALRLELQNDPDEASAPVLAARYLLGEHYLSVGEGESARRVVAPSLAAAPKPLAWLVEAEALYLAGAVSEAGVAAERAVSLAANTEQRDRIRERLADLLPQSPASQERIGADEDEG